MKKQTAVYLRQYGLSILIGAVISFATASYRGFALAQEAYWNARYWSDGFFVAGLLLTGMGALQLISTTGFFDIFSYAFHSLLVLFSSLKSPEKHPNYYDYKTAKAERRSKTQFYLLIVGICFIALSLLCLALYYQWLPGETA